ncbi:hypothetical protein SLA2020_088120 [Shorea laevis]
MPRNSYCIPVDDYGNQCNCSKGFEGNPYLPNGCQDINKCLDPNRNDCKDMICTNTVGSYTCSCPKGYHVVDINSEQGCVANQRHDWNLILRLLRLLGFGSINQSLLQKYLIRENTALKISRCQKSNRRIWCYLDSREMDSTKAQWARFTGGIYFTI